MAVPTSNVRAFFAIDLPVSLKSKVADAISELTPYDLPIKWVHPDNLHLTLKFLGETPQEVIVPLCEKLQKKFENIAPFPLVFKGIGFFPSSKVLSVFVQDPGSLYQRLVVIIEELSLRFGFAREERESQPHLTVARVKSYSRKQKELWNPFRLSLQKYAAENFGTMKVDDFFLFQSTLTGRGPIYEKLNRIELKGG